MASHSRSSASALSDCARQVPTRAFHGWRAAHRARTVGSVSAITPAAVIKVHVLDTKPMAVGAVFRHRKLEHPDNGSRSERREGQRVNCAEREIEFVL
jgi:hypothetical protein